MTGCSASSWTSAPTSTSLGPKALYHWVRPLVLPSGCTQNRMRCYFFLLRSFLTQLGAVAAETFDAEFNPEDADGHRAAFVARTALAEVLVRQACLQPRRRHAPEMMQGLASTSGGGGVDDTSSSVSNLEVAWRAEVCAVAGICWFWT